MGTKLGNAFRHQAQACLDLGSPFMHQLMGLCADRLRADSDLTRRMFDWPGDLGPSGASVPLRFAGALHSLARAGHRDLSLVYPPAQPNDDDLWRAVRGALDSDAAYIDAFIDNAPQTNEVRRAATLIAAGQWITATYGLPLDLFELGASAGLNLMWDRFELSITGTSFGTKGSPLTLAPEWQGLLPPTTAAKVISRHGVDLSPIDPHKGQDRLLSYIWPDQPHRRDLTQAAIALNEATVDQADAIDWLTDRLAPIEGRVAMIYSTVAWQYFPEAAKTRGAALIKKAGEAATPTAPIAWFTMEADSSGPGAALNLRLWPGDHNFNMGRADFHGRWVLWTPPEMLLPL